MRLQGLGQPFGERPEFNGRPPLNSAAAITTPFRSVLVAMMAIRILAALLFGIIYLVSSALSAQEPGLVEIYERWNTYTLDAPPPDMKPIILQVPEAFRYGSSRGARRDWGVNLITFYPSFTSPLAPENAPFIGRCAGDCNGQIMISIYNRLHSIHHPGANWGDYPNMGDVIARKSLDKSLVPNGSTVSDLEPQYGFDRGYEYRSPPTKKLKGQTNQYWFHLSEDDIHYDVAVECSINEFAQKCQLHYSLKCNPAIYVHIGGLEMQNLPNWMDVVAKSDRFVSLMVRVPSCLPNGNKQ